MNKLLGDEISLRKIKVEEDANIRLDKFIADKCEDLSRTMIQKLIEEEKIYINGKKAKSSVKVKKEDIVEIEEIEVKNKWRNESVSLQNKVFC